MFKKALFLFILLSYFTSYALASIGELEDKGQLKSISAYSSEVKVTAVTKEGQSDAFSGDEFGYSVAISGDTVVIGKPNDHDMGTKAGAVYVYKSDGMEWKMVQKLTDSLNGMNNDNFGTSVAIQDDIIVVGAPGVDLEAENSVYKNAGAAYIFRWNQVDALWENEDRLISEYPMEGGDFGRAVAIDKGRVVVGAPKEYLFRGSVYVFKWNEDTSTWQRDGNRILAPLMEQNSGFGFSVAIDDNTIVVGAPEKNIEGEKVGAIYVYERLVDGWSGGKMISPEQASPYIRFGFAVSLEGNLIVVGTPKDDYDGITSGSTFIFRLIDDVWYEEARLLASDRSMTDLFGNSVAILNGKVAIGAPKDDNENGNNAGSVYLFGIESDTWVEIAKVTASDGEEGDEFGYSLAIGDIPLVIGAYREDRLGLLDTGSVYVNTSSADLEVKKTGPANVKMGKEDVAYTITVANNGPDTAIDVVVMDNLPCEYISNVEYKINNGNWNADSGDLLAIHIGSLSAGTIAEIAVRFDVDPAAPALTVLKDIASATSAIADPDETNNNGTSADSFVDTLVGMADLAINKIIDNPEPRVKDIVTYTVSVTNNGPDAATNIKIFDMLPEGLNFVEANPEGAYDNETGLWQITSLLKDSSSVLHIVAEVETAGFITNTAEIIDSDIPDLNDSNNSSSAAIESKEVVDLAIEKEVDNNTPNVGDIVQFTLTATNFGPNDAQIVEAIDILPEGMTFQNAMPAESYDPITGVWNIGSLEKDQSKSLVIKAKIDDSGEMTNAVEVLGQLPPDYNLHNNVSDVTVIGQAADLVISNEVDNSEPNIGDIVTFTLTATNHGPYLSAGVEVIDILPDGLVFQGSDPEGAYDSSTGIWYIGELANDHCRVLKIAAKVESPETITNTANITGTNPPDINPSNNQASVSINSKSVDLDISMNVDKTMVFVEDELTYTLVVSNNGPEEAIGVLVKDKLPQGVKFISSYPENVYDSVYGFWRIASMEAGQSSTLQIKAKVEDSNSSISNIATVTAMYPTDIDLSNNIALTTVNCKQEADLSINSVVDKDVLTLGEEFIITLNVNNHGPNQASEIHVNDLLPEGLTFIKSEPEGLYDNNTGLWFIDNLSDGQSSNLSITASCNKGGSFIDSAYVSSSYPKDPDNSNNQFDVTIYCIEEADLSLTKKVDNSEPAIGDEVIFKYTVTNYGPNEASEILVSNYLPEGLTFIDDGSNDDYDEVIGAWHIDSLAKDESVTLEVVAKVEKSGKLLNITAITASSQTDPDKTNNSASIILSSGQQADLSIETTVDNTTPEIGDTITLKTKVNNNGFSTATGIKVVNILPEVLVYQSSSLPDVEFDPALEEIVWSIDMLPAGESVTIDTKAIVNSAEQVVVRNSIYQLDQIDPDNTNDTSLTVINCSDEHYYDLAIYQLSNLSTLTEGNRVSFTILVKNNGPGDADCAQIVNNLPEGLNFISSSVSGDSFDAENCIWSSGMLKPGEFAAIDIVAEAEMTKSNTLPLTNIVTIENIPDDINENNNSSEVQLVVSKQKMADLAVTAYNMSEQAAMDERLIETLVITNHGLADALSVELVNTVSDGLLIETAATSQGACEFAEEFYCSLGTILSGQTAEVQLTLIPVEKGKKIHTAEVHSLTIDPDESNNTLTKVLFVHPKDIGKIKTKSKIIDKQKEQKDKFIITINECTGLQEAFEELETKIVNVTVGSFTETIDGTLIQPRGKKYIYKFKNGKEKHIYKFIPDKEMIKLAGKNVELPELDNQILVRIEVPRQWICESFVPWVQTKNKSETLTKYAPGGQS